MSSILEEIETKIAGLKTSTSKSNVGVVRETGDGVARIEGLSDVMLNEMIEFPNGVFGLALNLEETEVGAILLGETTKVSEGDEVKTTGKLLQVPVGKALLGRVVNTIGLPLDDKGPIKTETFYPLEKKSPRALSSRRSVSQPVQTGIMAIDAMIPIGRGQRELIIGDRATGKSDDRDRHNHQSGALEQGRRRRRRQELSTALLHLRCDRSEEFQRRALTRRSRTRRRDAVHDNHFRACVGHSNESISRAVCRRGDGRVVHGQWNGRAHHL